VTIPGIIALFFTLVVLSATPSPSDLAIVARAIACGFGHGVLMALGMVCGDFLFILFAVFSLSALATKAAGLFVAIQVGCGLYLGVLGFKLWRLSGSARPSDGLKSDELESDELKPDGLKPDGLKEDAGSIYSGYSGFASFIGGLLVTLGDPLAIVFYMGLLPAFVDISALSVWDVWVLMVIAFLSVGGVKTTYAYLAVRAGALLSERGWRKGLERLSGAMLMGTALVLLARAV
jgi:threonine/homoserine/homoserine lactone efflux protein